MAGSRMVPVSITLCDLCFQGRWILWTKICQKRCKKETQLL